MDNLIIMQDKGASGDGNESVIEHQSPELGISTSSASYQVIGPDVTSDSFDTKIEHTFEELCTANEKNIQVDIIGSSCNIIEADESVILETHEHGLGIILFLVLGMLESTTNGLRDIYRTRLVCKSWKKWTDLYVSKRRGLIITELTHIEAILQDCVMLLHNRRETVFADRISLIELQDFEMIDEGVESVLALMRIVKPTLDELRIHNMMMVKHFHEIMRIVGGTIHTLSMRCSTEEFHECNSSKNGEAQLLAQEHFLPIVIDDVLMSYPQMEKVSIEPTVGVGTKLSTVLETFPNLNSLTISDIIQENRNIFKKLRAPNLNHLSLSLAYPGLLEQFHIDYLINLDLRLKHFELTIAGVSPKLKYHNYQQLFKTYKDNLQSLNLGSNISVSNPSAYIPSPFPLEFPSVKTAKIALKYIKNINNFIRSFPELINITFTSRKLDEWVNVFPKSDSELKQAKLVEMMEFECIDAVSFKKTASIFTNVKSLTLNYCNDEILRGVFSAFHKLQFLMIYFDDYHISSITVEAITGLEEERLKKLDIEKHSAKIKKRKWPWIGNLKSLEYLEIPFNYNSFSEMSDKAILFGLLKPPKLSMLNLVGDDFVSEKVHEISTAQLGFNIHLTTTHDLFVNGNKYDPRTKAVCFHKCTALVADCCCTTEFSKNQWNWKTIAEENVEESTVAPTSES